MESLYFSRQYILTVETVKRFTDLDFHCLHQKGLYILMIAFETQTCYPGSRNHKKASTLEKIAQARSKDVQ